MFLGKNIINGIFVSVALIIIIRLFLKKKVETHISLEIIRWTIVSYCFITIISWLLLLIFPHSEKYAFLERATGPYAWAYWLMLLFNCVTPLILLNKNIGKKIYLIFLITLFMNFGWIMEYFIILISSMHRDYDSGSAYEFPRYSRQLATLTKGFFLGIVVFIVGNGIKKLKEKKRTHNNV